MSDVLPGPRWSITPGRGIGPLRIGMPVDAAIRALDDAGLGPVERSRKAAAPVYASRGRMVQVRPGTVPAVAETVTEIEVLTPASVDLFGEPLLNVPLAAAEQFLRSRDDRTERQGSLVTSPGLGVRVWSDDDAKDDTVASVSVTGPMPLALVLAPSFTFPELDEAMRRAGFAGGATTLRAPLLPGEPELAEWRRRHVLLRYSLDPVSMLRVLYLCGPETPTAPLVQKLIARLPRLGEQQVLADLATTDDVTRLRAVQAAAVLRLVAARDQLSQLISTAPEPVRTAAMRSLIDLPDAPAG